MKNLNSNIFINNLFNIFDPLAQFETFNGYFALLDLVQFFKLNERNINLIIPNLVIFYIFFMFILLFFFYTDTKNTSFIFWNYIKFFKIQSFNFTENVVKANSSLDKQNWFLILFFTFILIISVNIIGPIPFVFTITSSFAVTFAYSLIIFICINILGIYRTGFLKFFEMFLPSGTPLSITFLLILIELISYIARLFSLSIRLFANMMAGHTLLKTLIGFSFSILMSNFLLFPIAFIPWIIVTMILILEILIGLLQGYVYLILACIYINDVVLKH